MINLSSPDTLKYRFDIEKIGDCQMFLEPPRHHPKNGRYKDEEYLAWIRTFPCLSCSKEESVEAHHHWKTRWNDYTALPLCVKCHRFGIHAAKSPKQWEEDRGLNLNEEIMRYNMLYIALIRKKI